MHIERIEHSKTIEMVNSFGLKEWVKNGVSVVLSQEESPELALEMAKDFVSKSYLSNPQAQERYIPEEQLPVIRYD